MNDHDEFDETDPTERDPGWYLLVVLALVSIMTIIYQLAPYAGGK